MNESYWCNTESVDDVDPLAVTDNDEYDDITEIDDNLYPECQVRDKRFFFKKFKWNILLHYNLWKTVWDSTL